MKQEKRSAVAFRYALIGFGVGVFIWLISAAVEMYLNKYNLNFSSLAQLHKQSFSFYIIDLLPFIIGYFAYKVGQYLESKDTKYNTFVSKEENRNTKLIQIVDQIKNGNFNISNGSNEDDKLIDSILALRDSLKNSKEEEMIRKTEDEQRHWVAQGLAKFGEILRANNDNMTELSYNIISQLVKYTSTNQGGIYLLTEDKEDGHPVFEMTGCYAYERRKFVDKYINFGEGLVGSCAKEAKTVYMTSIPDSYLSITSGLGKANPRHLLLVPLKINEEVHGVLEMASFKPIDKHVIEFVEKVAESIASTVANVKINIRTATLLEESREQAEMLSSQEEEMRQNMEELQATQEESVRQTDKLTGYVNALDSVLMRAEFDSFGNLVLANDAFLNTFEVPIFDDINERPITSFIHPEEQVEFRAEWAKVIAEKKSFEGAVKFTSFINKTLYLNVVLTRIDDKDGDLDRVLFLANNITESKKVELEEKTLLSAFEGTLLKAELTTTGDFLTINKKFKTLLGLKDQKSFNINDFINDLEKSPFEKAWKRVINNGSFEGTINLNYGDNKVASLEASLFTIKNFSNDIVKVVLIANDKSATKTIEDKYEELRQVKEALEEQLKKTDEELNKRVREVREELAQQYKEADKIRIRNDKAVDNAPFPMIGFSSAGLIEVFNKKASELWGYQPNEVMNKSVSILFPKEMIQTEGYVASICDVDKIKPLNQKDQATIVKKDQATENVYITLSDARVTKEHNYIAYVDFSNN